MVTMVFFYVYHATNARRENGNKILLVFGPWINCISLMSEILGLEASGVITDIGPGVKGNWKLGSKVRALLGGGGYAEYVAVPEEHVMPVPSPLTLPTSTLHRTFSANLNFLMNYFFEASKCILRPLYFHILLFFIAKVKPNEMVLIHEPCDSSSNSREFGKVTISQSRWEQLIAIDGRWVLYGMLGGKTADGDLLGKLLRKRGNLLCSLLRSRRLQYKVELVRSFTEQVLPHFKSTDPLLWPVIDSMFNMEDVEMAHQRMQANKNIGKIIIKIGNS
uniref:Alcohol dehydrogenase-like N-terminal domain-containing protein n=1 Tax=Cyprinus carpio TaxID=7962 RepID=A0A8C2KLX0_CYPCA